MNQSSRVSTHKKHQKASLGKIYTIKRQPLTQILHYPKSVMIDDYYLDQLCDPLSKNKLSKQKVIKFVGDEEENIRLIIQSLDGLNECENKIMMAKQKALIQDEFSQILTLFYRKIKKIRRQRDVYKTSLETQKNDHSTSACKIQHEIEQLKQQIFCLKKQKQCMIQKFDNESKKRQFFQRQNMILQQKQKMSILSSHQNADIVNCSVQNLPYLSKQKLTNQNFLANETQDQFQSKKETIQHKFLQTKSSDLFVKSKNEKSYRFSQDSNSNYNESQKGSDMISSQQRQQLENILRKHNLQPSQLGQIIEEYLKELKQNYEIEFQNAQQKRLYFLAKKMETKIWNKKVKKDIEKLMHGKE